MRIDVAMTYLLIVANETHEQRKKMMTYTNCATMIDYAEAEEEGEDIDNDVIWSFYEDEEGEAIVGGVHLRIELEEWDIDGKIHHTLCGVVETYCGGDTWDVSYRDDFFEQTPEQIAEWVDEKHRAEVLAAVHELFVRMEGTSKMAA